MYATSLQSKHFLVQGLNHRPQSWEAGVLSLYHHVTVKPPCIMQSILQCDITDLRTLQVLIITNTWLCPNHPPP